MENLNDQALETLFNDMVYLIEELGSVYVVVSQTEEFKGSDDYGFLANILKAVKQDINKVNIQNIHTNPLPDVKEGVILLFGVNCFQAGFKDISINKYEVFEQNNITFMEADQLRDISLDVTKKKALWSCLQRAFNL